MDDLERQNSFPHLNDVSVLVHRPDGSSVGSANRIQLNFHQLILVYGRTHGNPVSGNVLDLDLDLFKRHLLP